MADLYDWESEGDSWIDFLIWECEIALHELAEGDEG